MQIKLFVFLCIVACGLAKPVKEIEAKVSPIGPHIFYIKNPAAAHDIQTLIRNRRQLNIGVGYQQQAGGKPSWSANVGYTIKFK